MNNMQLINKQSKENTDCVFCVLDLFVNSRLLRTAGAAGARDVTRRCRRQSSSADLPLFADARGAELREGSRRRPVNHKRRRCISKIE